MREAGDREDVRQLCRDARVSSRRIRLVLLRLLGRLHAEERRVRRALAMYQGHEAEIGQLLLPAVGDGRLGRALHRDVAGIAAEGMDREAFDEPTALHTPDGSAPAVRGEGLVD